MNKTFYRQLYVWGVFVKYVLKQSTLQRLSNASWTTTPWNTKIVGKVTAGKYGHGAGKYGQVSYYIFFERYL